MRMSLRSPRSWGVGAACLLMASLPAFSFRASRPSAGQEVERYTLVCSTYLGGLGYDEGREIMESREGSLVVGGQTYSTRMPAPGGFQTTYRGSASRADGAPATGNTGGDAYLAWITPDCSSVSSATYLGGSSQERSVYGMEQVADGIIVSGVTRSSDFPTTAGAYQRSYGGGTSDSWVAKFPHSPQRLSWSTLLGGTGGDWLRAGAAVAGDGSIWAAGHLGTAGRSTDALVYRLAANGDSVALRVTLGGSEDDEIVGILALPGGDAFINGHTRSRDFPRTVGPEHGGGWDRFYARLSPAGSVRWSRLDGLPGEQFGEHRPVLCGGRVVVPTTAGIVILDPDSGAIRARIDVPNFPVAPSCGPDGRIYVGGLASGAGLAVTPGALQPTYRGGASDGWFMVARVDGTVDYATYLGGEGTDMVRGTFVTRNGMVLLIGRTDSDRFPLAGTPYQRTHSGDSDMFVAVLAREARGTPLPAR